MSETAGRGVARGTRLSRPARRAQLLAAAQEVFVANGYHATGMDEIAERAQVSKPVLYQHFPGKFELYVALLDRADEEMLAAVREALASSTRNKARIAATVTAYFDFVTREGRAYRLVFESDLGNDPLVRDRLADVHRRCAEAIAPLIRADAGLSEPEAHLVASGIVGMAQVSARTWLREGTVPREEAARLVAQLAWRGMRGLPRRDDGASPTGAGHDDTPKSGRGVQEAESAARSGR